jgi:RNA polymerase sigma-70 factor (ECF subfamily)
MIPFQAASARSASMTDQLSPDRILAQAGWVRDLAQRLVSDAHLAEDLAQETMAAALEHPPAEELKLRPWLARVLRNFLNQFARREGRRRLREEAAARYDAEDPDELARQVAVHHELSGAVLELDEPYRTAIVLRYFRELPPREIARQMGVPVKTVNSRLTRGLRKLRERLDRAEGGNRRAWMLALFSLGDRPEGLGATTLGVVAVNAKLIFCAASIAAIAAVATLMTRGEAPAEPDSVAAAEIRAPEPGPAGGVPGAAVPAGAALREEERTPVLAATPTPLAVGEPEAAAPLSTVRGRVFDADGAPVAGVEVALEGGEHDPALSAAGGWFELRTRALQGRLVGVQRVGWTTVRQGVWNVRDNVHPVVVVAPTMELAGEVIDESGWSLAGARLKVELPHGFETRFDENLESSRPLGWRASADDRGRFAFDAVPAVQGSVLTTVLDGYEPLRLEAPSTTDMALTLTLTRPSAPLEGSLKGRVVDVEGRPVPAARVALGLTSLLSDEEGAFRIDLARAVTSETLRAVKEGFLPAVVERPYEPLEGDTGWPEFVELRLGGPALSIAGRVVDHRGEPVAGVRLWLADPTPFGVVGRMPAQMEGLMGGALVPPMALEAEANAPAEDGDNYWDYSSQAGPSTAFWSWVRTGADGRFELPGLADRAYRIKVMDDESLGTHESKRIRAGEAHAEIRLPAPDVWPVFKGRVLGPRGVPMPGVELTVRHEAYVARSRVFGGRMEVGLNQSRESTTTDEQGRFEFRDLPKSGIYVSLRSNDIVPSSHELAGLASGEGVELTVEARCPVEVVLERTPGADTLRVFADDGERLDVLRISGGSVNATTGLSIVNGRTGVFSVSSRARVIVLYADGEEGEELTRLPVSLRPGQVNLIRD